VPCEYASFQFRRNQKRYEFKIAAFQLRVSNKVYHVVYENLNNFVSFVIITALRLYIMYLNPLKYI